MPISVPTTTLEKYSNFGDLLRFLRRRVGLTQMDLANAVGYSHTQISRLEQNLRLPDIPIIESNFITLWGSKMNRKSLHGYWNLLLTCDVKTLPRQDYVHIWD